MPPLMVRASPEVVLVKTTAAVEASSERRDIRAGEKASNIALFRNLSVLDVPPRQYRLTSQLMV
jgi:hypothetical protein